MVTLSPWQGDYFAYKPSISVDLYQIPKKDTGPKALEVGNIHPTLPYANQI
jgi:hypothetical protein